MDTEVRKEYERRLTHLQIRAAKQGINTPPEILIEIEDIQRCLNEDFDVAELRAPDAATNTSRPIRNAYKRQSAAHQAVYQRNLAHQRFTGSANRLLSQQTWLYIGIFSTVPVQLMSRYAGPVVGILFGLLIGLVIGMFYFVVFAAHNKPRV